MGDSTNLSQKGTNTWLLLDRSTQTSFWSPTNILQSKVTLKLFDWRSKSASFTSFARKLKFAPCKLLQLKSIYCSWFDRNSPTWQDRKTLMNEKARNNADYWNRKIKQNHHHNHHSLVVMMMTRKLTNTKNMYTERIWSSFIQ